MSFVTMQPIALAASAGMPRGIRSAVNGGDAAASATGTGRSPAWCSGLALPAGNVTFGAVLRLFGAVSATFGSRCAVELGAKVTA